MTLKSLAPGLHTAEAPQSFLGLEVGARMTALSLSGGLLLHSPVAGPLPELPPPRWVLAPNLLHHLHVGPLVEAGAELWAPPGLAAKRPDLRVSGCPEPDGHPFGPEVEIIPLTCMALTRELLVLHRPSRTLIVTDLLFHFTASAPWRTRAVMRAMGGHPGCRTTWIERLLFDRAAARRELGEVAERDFDRLIMAHGEPIEAGGKRAFKEALAWLGI